MNFLVTISQHPAGADSSEMARRRAAIARRHPQAVWGVIWEMLRQRPAEWREAPELHGLALAGGASSR
jgi:hypothetical protein